MSQRDYLLSDNASELERLRLQARVWEPETEAWLDRLGPIEGCAASIWAAERWVSLGLFRGALGRLGASWAWTSTLCSFAARAPSSPRPPCERRDSRG
jgi:hypothetical protein